VPLSKALPTRRAGNFVRGRARPGLLENPFLRGLIFQELITGITSAGDNSGWAALPVVDLETTNPSTQLTLSQKQLRASSLGRAGGAQNPGPGVPRL
jgi:hypothetical protein